MTGQFTSQDGHKYTVIIRPAISGTLTMAADPVHIAWESSDGNPYQPVRSVSATIRVQTATSLATLYTADPLGCPVCITKDDSVCIFLGFLTPQEWQSPSDNGYNEVEMVAVDALTALKTVNYTRYGTSVQLRKPSAFVSNAISVINAALAAGMLSKVSAKFADTLPWDEQSINEQAFLPDAWDASVHDDDRTPWTDVFTALGTYLGGTFMMEGNKLRFIKVDDIASTTRVEVGTHLTGASMEMVPAKSAIEVSYNTTEQCLIPAIDKDRLDVNNAVARTSYAYQIDSSTWGVVDTSYVEAYDWEPLDTTRTVCGAVIRHYKYAIGAGKILSCDTYYAIVGPARLRTSAKHVTDGSTSTMATGSIGLWCRDDMDMQSGYPVLTIFDKKRNVDAADLDIEFGSSSSPITFRNVVDTTEMDKKETFESVNLLDKNPLSSYSGQVMCQIGDGVVLNSLDVKRSQRLCSNWLVTYNYLFSEEDIEDFYETLYTIADTYDEKMSVDVTLRKALTADYTDSDDGTTAKKVHRNLCYTDTDVPNGYDAYPYVTPAQFEAPRPRYQLTLPSIPSMSLLQAYSLKKHDSSHLYLPDGADFDLRMNQATLSLLQTWQEY